MVIVDDGPGVVVVDSGPGVVVVDSGPAIVVDSGPTVVVDEGYGGGEVIVDDGGDEYEGGQESSCEMSPKSFTKEEMAQQRLNYYKNQ